MVRGLLYSKINISKPPPNNSTSVAVIAILLSALLLGEPIGWQEIVGAVLILGSAVCSELQK